LVKAAYVTDAVTEVTYCGPYNGQN